nr:MAG TPA: hypothetical protein [Bacteriophage sp.]
MVAEAEATSAEKIYAMSWSILLAVGNKVPRKVAQKQTKGDRG